MRESRGKAFGYNRSARCCAAEWLLVIAAIHMFNHGTHHRGQLTTLMKQAGRDPGPTDLPWLPGVVRIVA